MAGPVTQQNWLAPYVANSIWLQQNSYTLPCFASSTPRKINFWCVNSVRNGKTPISVFIEKEKKNGDNGGREKEGRTEINK
jgi:hypothetical protein